MNMWRILFLLVVAAALLLLVLIGVPAAAAHSYGPPSHVLGPLQIMEYSARLLWDDGLLTKPLDPRGPQVEFAVRPEESVASICERLQRTGLVLDGNVMRDYLVYTGLDTGIQAGLYKLKPSMSIIDIAQKMQDATPTEVKFIVLPGWRIEEIAMSLPSSGLEIPSTDFVASAKAPNGAFDFLSGAGTAEGFLFPDTYTIPRSTTTPQLVDILIRAFALHLRTELQEGYARQGLSLYQAVILASIVQREAVQSAEAPLIASVYLNRLRAGMRLNADPTVQYAIGYNAAQATWWTNPLSLDDLKFVSPFNTYLVDGLPPAPIDNPGLDALQAVALPTESPYFYFNARCDGSGYHTFSETFDEHLNTLCP